MASINNLSAEVLRGIVEYLDAFEITALDFVVNAPAKRKIRHQAVDHLEWTLYEFDNEEAAKERPSAAKFVGELVVPRSLMEYRRLKSVHLSSYKLPSHVKLMPQEAHLRAWGATLTSLKLESFHLLVSLLSPLGLSLYCPNPRKKYSDNIMTLWQELEKRDQLPEVPGSSRNYQPNPPPYRHPNPDPSTLTNPWLPLNDILPHLTLLYLHQLGDSNEVIGEVYSAEYMAILWKQLPPNLEELSHNLSIALHPAMVKYLPRKLKTYISPHAGHKHSIPQFRSYDERCSAHGIYSTDTANSESFRGLPSTIESLIVPFTNIGSTEIVHLPPSLTRLVATAGYQNPGVAAPPASFPPLIQHLNYSFNGILETLPSTLKSWDDSTKGTAWSLQNITQLPRTLTSLSLWTVMFDPKIGFADFPQQLKTLKIRLLGKTSLTAPFSHPIKREHRHILSASDLGSLPSTLTELNIDPHCKYAQDCPLDEQITLQCLPCKELIHLECNVPFVIRKTPTAYLPMLKTMNLPLAKLTPQAVAGMTDLLKNKVWLPQQLIDA